MGKYILLYIKYTLTLFEKCLLNKEEDKNSIFVCFILRTELREEWENLGHVVWPECGVQILVLFW